MGNADPQKCSFACKISVPALLPLIVGKLMTFPGKKGVRIPAYNWSSAAEGWRSLVQPSAEGLGLGTQSHKFLPKLSDKLDLPFSTWKCLTLFFARIKSSAWISLILVGFRDVGLYWLWSISAHCCFGFACYGGEIGGVWRCLSVFPRSGQWLGLPPSV